MFMVLTLRNWSL